ncbi:complement factor b, like isoform X2 [Ctenopharyngodon idella]|uniref:complement factor b, like isoform X2 n=1 Tax=Ctenopharyngodon idella TaxID=7959 RepID=UPI002230F2D5|nr:complement factor b, like isoform X2 [Ctenopharyngodon idella]
MEHEPWLNLFMLAMLCPLITGAPSSNLCSEENLRISGGSFSFSKDGSLVRYSCSEGYYPTVKIRRCNKGGWNPMPKRKPPECKKITCPDPRGFENGEVYPYLPRYFVNDTTHYSCHSGYTFRGSGVRVCQLNGKWSGSTPVCGRNSDHCPDPGTPAGSTRTGHIFNIDDKVIYRCDKTLTLIGSKERVCQDDGQWSGTEPECYADFTYDTPEEASEAFSSSLKSNLAVSQQDEGTDQYGKKIHVDKGGKLDIYIALDVSDSIEEDDFEKAKDVIKTLIDKISYYEVSPNYEILIFATDVYRIVSMRDFKSGQGNNLEQILKRLANYKYESKGDRSGTNIAQAYKNILESMQIEQITNKEDFLETQHIVIMFSDGQANMGGNPKVHVDNIKNLVINDPSREDKLELYVFGMGDDVNAEDINDLKTDRGNEKFFFKLQSIEKLQETFDNMIGIKVKQYIPHPRYNLRAKKHMGIPEYYEFDVALIQLVEPLIMGVDLRPICIPCTKETSGALRLSDREGTCRKHQEVLMSAETVNAAFISERKKKIEKKFIKIKQGKWRDSCIEDAKKAEGITATNAEDIVTDNFLCSGGTEPNRDDIACKGDSGGATFVVPGNRMVQVGIISWGVKDLCARNPNAMSEPQSRDYHTSLFSAEVRSFLKDYVGDGTLGTPLTFL